MDCKVIPPNTLTTCTSDEDQTAAQKKIKVSESRKYDAQIPDETQIRIRDNSVMVLTKDVSTTILMPADAGVFTVVVEVGKGIICAPDEENKKETKEGKEEWKEEKTAISGITGSFNSNDVREPGSVNTCDFKEFPFFGSRNRPTNRISNKDGILVGLNLLDFDHQGELLVKAVAERKIENNNNSKNFKIKLETWGDSKMNCAGCDWITLPHVFTSAAGIQYGSYDTTENHSRRYSPDITRTRNVTFTREYTKEEGVPEVAIWFNSLEIEKASEMYDIRTWVSGIDRMGFKINVSSLKVILFAAGVTWLSYPRGKEGIGSSQFQISSTLGGGDDRAMSAGGKIAFKGMDIAYVFAGLNQLKAGGSMHTRVRVKAEAEPNGEEVAWRVNTWDSSTVGKAGGTVIVLE